MRVLLDTNVILDCLILEKDGSPRAGKAASDEVLERCDRGIHQGLVAWHTLPIVAYYYQQQHDAARTGALIDGLLNLLEVPVVGHADAVGWRSSGLTDFEDALQVASALAGRAAIIVTRNTADFAASSLPALTPEAFLSAFPL